MGRGAPREFVDNLMSIANSHHEHLSVDCIRAYHFGSRFIVELEVLLPPKMTVEESHDIALFLQHKVRPEFLDKRCRPLQHTCLLNTPALPQAVQALFSLDAVPPCSTARAGYSAVHANSLSCQMCIHILAANGQHVVFSPRHVYLATDWPAVVLSVAVVESCLNRPVHYWHYTCWVCPSSAECSSGPFWGLLSRVPGQPNIQPRNGVLLLTWPHARQ